MKKESPSRRMVGLWIFAVVIAAILIGSTVWIEIVKNSYRQDIDRTQKTFLSLSRNATAMEETKRRRVEYFRNCFSTDFPARYLYGAADFMRRLSLIDARGIDTARLAINPRGQDFAFNLNVGVTGGNNSRAQGIFSRFYQMLKDFEGMVEINFSIAKPGTGEIKKITTSRGTRGTVKLFYKIEGVIELE